MGRTKSIRRAIVIVALSCALGVPASQGQESSGLDRVLDTIVANEQGLMDRLRAYQPLVETYLQSTKPAGARGEVPVRDRYFLARLQLPEVAPSGKKGKSDRTRSSRKSNDKLLDVYEYSVSANPDGFAKMLTLDAASFDREHYGFEFVRREFLGEVRTLVFDVRPTVVKGAKPGRFSGRIWVEDRDYHIVRFNGLYGSIFRTNLHFDSWRINAAPGLWLPAYVYTEEPDRPGGDPKVRHKGQTRIWGYDVKQRDPEEEFSKILIDAPLTNDQSESPGEVSPVESFRAWEREAEENVLQRLERAGILAPKGEISDILETVVANIEVTNELEVYPPIRCRVLLTTPLESFTVGHTIVLSRGMIDVLPDEASLAMVLAHEMGHILGGHRLDTRYAFSNQILAGDKETLQQFQFERDPLEELEADERAVALLENSPYKDQLAGAGLFLKALGENAAALATLIQPHFGNRMGDKSQMTRMQAIVASAPDLDWKALDQVAALPLGGRVKVDPWSARAELMKTTRAALLSPREKMAFQITPLMPYLVRFDPQQDRADEVHEAEGPASAPTTQEPQEEDETVVTEAIEPERARSGSR